MPLPSLKFIKFTLAVRALPTLLAPLFLSIPLLTFSNAQAELLRIFHSNDLHGFVDHYSAMEPNLGGFAYYRTLHESLKNERYAGSNQPLPSIHLNSGDFLEGSAYFLSSPPQIFRAMNSLFFDATTLGNHDWLMGLWDLDQTLQISEPNFPILAANVSFDHAAHPTLARKIMPHVTIQRGGFRIAVIGITTNEAFYRWASKTGTFIDPADCAAAYLADLRAHHDLVIALTHIGLDKDRELIQKTPPGIDLVVGGHSHTRLDQVVYERHPVSGKYIPIVQAGEHGRFLGDLVLDLDRATGNWAVMEYHLREIRKDEITRTLGGPHPATQQVVETVLQQFRDYFGEEYLSHVVGYSEVPLQYAGMAPTTWGDFVADALKAATGAEVGYDIGVCLGPDQPAGPITREAIIRAFPRMFEYSQSRTGYQVYTWSITGFVAELVLQFAVENGFVPIFSGFTWDLERRPNGKLKAKNIRVNGRSLQPLASYRIASSEAVVRGAYGASPLMRFVITHARRESISVREAIEQHFARQGGVLRASAYHPESHFIPGANLNERRIPDAALAIEQLFRERLFRRSSRQVLREFGP